MKNYLDEYNLVDFASKHTKGFRNNIVSVHRIPELLKRYHYDECYSTFFLYSRDILDYMKSNIRKGRRSVGGYAGKVYASMFPIDIDSPVLDESLGTAREFTNFFVSYWEVPKEALQIYFSGSAGFHLTLDSRVFGRVEPSKSLHLIFSDMRKKISDTAKVKNKETIDYTIKDRVRLFRLPNTRNEKSGLYKVSLEINELFNYSIKEIKEKAKTRQPLVFTDESGLISTCEEISPVELARELHNESLDKIRTRANTQSVVMRKYSTEDMDPTKILCPAKRKIWETQIEVGKRNEATVRLASEFKVSGFDKNKSLGLLIDWNKKRNIGLPEEEINSVVDSVYSASVPYNYGCKDEILNEFCPYEDKSECKYYRAYKTLTSLPRNE